MKEGKMVLSLCDRTGNMVKPWLEAGYECWIVDIEHEEGIRREKESYEGELVMVGKDVLNCLPPRREYKIAFAFPPCTNLAVSGARWFKQKGLSGLSEGIRLVEKCAEILQWTEAPWMLENPVSVLSSYWRNPDFIFHPYEYDGYTEEDNAYSKKTCLWTGNGFVMPEKCPSEDFDDRIHQMQPGEERGVKRSVTPEGFAEAVYEANK